MELNMKYVRRSLPRPERGRVYHYIVDKDEELAFALSVEEGVSKAHFLEGKEWGMSPLDPDRWDVQGAGNKPGELIIRDDRSEGEPGALYFADAERGELGIMIFRAGQYDFRGSMFRDPTSRDLVGLIYDQAGPRNVWFNPEYAKLQKSLDTGFRGKAVRIMEGDVAGTKFLLHVYSDRHPSAYYFIDLVSGSLDLVAESRPWLDPQRLQPRRIMKFKTEEGVELDAYFTLPLGASKEDPPPLVVLPHGGPWVRDHWSFDAEAQFLASRRYAGLQPNYRGSTGYDWIFPYEDRWDFVKMHDDVTRAAKTLIATGRVDANRVAIAGGLFGGYLALMGAVHEPELYQCAVTFAGVFDWAELMKMEKRQRHSQTDFQVLLRHLGLPDKSPEKFERISPGRRVADISMPVFVAHGTEDSVVSVGESKRLIADLKKHNVTHETAIIRGEGHGTYNVENSVEYHGQMEAFLRRHLNPSL